MVDAVSRDGYVIAQEYLPPAQEGDTRLFLVGLDIVCCESSQQAPTPAVREAHFAAAGDSRDQAAAEAHLHAACAAPPGSILRLLATGIRRDLDGVAVITAQRRDDPAIKPEFFGPLWPSEAPRGWPDG